MPLSGICKSCGEISHALQICVHCGSRVCLNCINSRENTCKLCEEKKEEILPDLILDEF